MAHRLKRGDGGGVYQCDSIAVGIPDELPPEVPPADTTSKGISGARYHVIPTFLLLAGLVQQVERFMCVCVCVCVCVEVVQDRAGERESSVKSLPNEFRYELWLVIEKRFFLKKVLPPFLCLLHGETGRHPLGL